MRQLMERGSLPRAVVPATSREVVPDPDNPANVMLRAERDLRARVAGAVVVKRAVPWDDLPVRERLLFRQQHVRLGLKRLTRDGAVYPAGKYGVRGRRELRLLISDARGGVECFDAFAEYPGAHADVLELLAAKKIAAVATTLWSTRSSRRQNPE